MKDATLLELAARWERDAALPQVQGLVEQDHDDARDERLALTARRATLRECAGAVRMLVTLLGDKP